MLRGTPPSETEKNLRAILDKLKADHIPVLLTGMQAQRNLGAEYVKEFDAIYPRLAKDYHVLFYPFILDGVALNPKLNQADGMHPNPAGVKIIVARILPYVKKLVAKARTLMFKKLLSVGGFTLLSRITGFARDMLMAWTLGSGMLSDAFLVAFIFPNYFRAIFGEGTINPAFLPRYAALRAQGEDKAAAKFANEIFAWQMAAQVRASGAGDHLHAPDHQRAGVRLERTIRERFDLTVRLARITFPYLILTLVAMQLSAMLNAIEKFWAAAAWSNFQNLAMIATLVAWHWFPNAAYAAAWGVVLGGVAQLVFILWAGWREGLWLALHLAALVARDRRILQGVRRGDVRRGERGDLALHRHAVWRAGCPSAAGPRFIMATASISCRWVCWASRWARCSCRKCRPGWRRAIPSGSHTAQNRSAAMCLLLTLPFMVVFHCHSRHHHARLSGAWRLPP